MSIEAVPCARCGHPVSMMPHGDEAMAKFVSLGVGIAVEQKTVCAYCQNEVTKAFLAEFEGTKRRDLEAQIAALKADPKVCVNCTELSELRSKLDKLVEATQKGHLDFSAQQIIRDAADELESRRLMALPAVLRKIAERQEAAINEVRPGG